MLQLYKHQEEILIKNPSKHLIAFDRGTGKTLTGLLLAGKNSTTLNKNITYIIVPKKVKSKWENDKKEFCPQIREFLSRDMVEENLIVMTKEEFKRDARTLPKPRAVIVDECFPAGTKILTPSGYTNIEEIKVGDTIISAMGKDTVYHVGSRIVDYLFLINIGGKVISTTPEHKFLVYGRGWVEAQNLQLSDELLHYSNVHDIIDYHGKSMYTMQESSSSWVKGEKAKILYEELYNEISLEHKEGLYGRQTQDVLCEKSRESKEFIETNDRKEPNGKFNLQGENDFYVKETWTQTQNSWWKRADNARPAESIIGRAWCWLVCRACCSNTIECKTKSLQNRHSKSTNYGGSGNRRQESRVDISSEAGQEKRGCLKIFRVEGLSIQKRGGTRVFNLGVTGHPSYVVEDILVHNCHYFAGLKSQLSKSLQWFVRTHNIEFIWLLTATPYLSTPWNIFTLGRCLGMDLQYNFWLRTFFKPKYLGIKVVHVPDESKEAELQAFIRSIGTVVPIDDVVVDLPDQQDKFIHVFLSDQQKEALSNVSLLNPLTGFTQKHQIENGVKKGNEYEEDTQFEDYKTIFLLDIKKNNKKMAVFCRYSLQIEKYEQLFTNAGYKTLTLTGKTKDAGEVIRSAVDSEDVVILIQAQCSEGYELPNFDVVVFASMSFSFKDYTQAKGRFLRINKLKENTFIHLLISGQSVDAAVMSAIRRKQDFDVDLFCREINKLNI